CRRRHLSDRTWLARRSAGHHPDHRRDVDSQRPGPYPAPGQSDPRPPWRLWFDRESVGRTLDAMPLACCPLAGGIALMGMHREPEQQASVGRKLLIEWTAQHDRPGKIMGFAYPLATSA